MKLTLKRDLPLLLAALLVIWGLWYARPIGKNKHAADGDFRKRLCGNSGFLHRLDLRRDRKP